MEKEYTVVVHKGVNLVELESEITASSGAGPIPNRSVDIANPRPGSKRQTHFMLTDEEATALEADSRVLAVEIPPDQRTDIQIGLNSTQTANFTKPVTFSDNSLVNWGLRRSIMEENNYQNSNTSDNTFPYALTGKGVDIVIQDSGIQPDHPDFIDSNGISRVKPIDWYTAQSVVSGTQNANYNRDFDGHGTLCASITAGNIYGFAKDAHIYSMKIAGLEGAGDTGTGTPIADCFDVIKEWHNAKTNGRPTVVNMSWGYSSTVTGDPTSGTYRGTGWVWGVDYTTDVALWQGTGVVIPLAGTTRKIPARIASVDADVDELIAAGVHVAIAAGNDYYKGDVSGGDRYWQFTSTEVNQSGAGDTGFWIQYDTPGGYVYTSTFNSSLTWAINFHQDELNVPLVPGSISIDNSVGGDYIKLENDDIIIVFQLNGDANYGGPGRTLYRDLVLVYSSLDTYDMAGKTFTITRGDVYNISGGDDYNNTVIFGGLTFNYGRGSSPHSDDAFIVGNISTSVYDDGGIYKDRTQGSSSKGPRVNIWAPGTNIVGATSTTNIYTSLDSPVDAAYKIVSLSGTSFASPQVAGVAALHLQVNANSTPAQLKTKLLAEAKPVMYDTASDTDYASFTTSLLGASNKVLFDKYGRQPVEVNGANLKLQGIFPNFTSAEVASPAIDPEYNNGAIIDLTGDGSNFFSREVTVNGVRIVAAGSVGGQTAVPDAFVEKVARMFELFTDPNGAGINEASQRTFIKTLSGDAGTYHAAQGPTLQRVARGAGADYSTNFLTDAGIIFWNLTALLNATVQNDMVWYLNSTGDPPGDGDNDAQEVIEHVFHTLHMHGLDAVSLKMYSYISADWASGPLYAAMEEAYDAGKWDSSGYGGNAWKTDGDAFEVAAKEYLFLLNFGMFEYSSLWDGGSLAPEWTDDMRTQSGIQANNPLGYALHNTYIAPVISKPSLTTIRNIFQDGDVGDPTVAGPSGYVPD